MLYICWYKDAIAKSFLSEIIFKRNETQENGPDSLLGVWISSYRIYSILDFNLGRDSHFEKFIFLR